MSDYIDDIILKLERSGCRKDIIDAYVATYKKKNIVCSEQMLKRYRKELQKEIDAECKSIDCIDYLIYDMQKKK